MFYLYRKDVLEVKLLKHLELIEFQHKMSFKVDKQIK